MTRYRDREFFKGSFGSSRLEKNRARVHCVALIFVCKEVFFGNFTCRLASFAIIYIPWSLVGSAGHGAVSGVKFLKEIWIIWNHIFVQMLHNFCHVQIEKGRENNKLHIAQKGAHTWILVPLKIDTMHFSVKNSSKNNK